MRRHILGIVLALAAPFALAQSTIKIAILGPMAFVQGENHWAGAEMARDEINKAGGISIRGKKRMVELVKQYGFTQPGWSGTR